MGRRGSYNERPQGPGLTKASSNGRTGRALLIGAFADCPALEGTLALDHIAVHRCRDLAHALTRAGEEPFTLVLVDSESVADEDVCVSLRARGQAGTFIFLGKTADSDELRALRAGADVFLPRPLVTEQLALALDRARPILIRPLPLFGPLSVIPAQRSVVAEDMQVHLSEAEYDLLLMLAETPRTWISLASARDRFNWRLRDEATAARLKELTRRVRRRLGAYGGCVAFSRRHGVCLREVG